jgi:diguanylate cyclase (GGDEF)-like protein/PAS domain S-box-containing protein
MLISKEPKILAGQLKTVFKFYPIAITSNYVLVLLSSFIFSYVASSSHVIGWLLAATLICLVRYKLYKDYQLMAKKYSYSQWLIRHTIATAISGLIWGYAFLFLMPNDSFAHLLFLVIAIAGLCSGASSTLALSPLAFILFLAACLLPMSFKLYSIDPDYGWLLFGLCYIYMYSMWATCQRNNESAYKNIRQAFSLDEKERQLKIAEQRVELNFEHSPLGIIEWDTQLQITRWNPAAEAIFGYSSEDMLQQPYQKLLRDKSQSDYFLHISNAIQSVSTVIKSTTSSGAMINCEWTSTTISLPSGHLLGYTSFVRDISKKLEQEELMAQQAYTDPVTGLPNRYYFQDRLQQEISRTNRSKKHSAVFFVDLDQFKTINDSMGHSVGDILLQQFAERLQTRLRQYDTVARFGGDEFVVLLQELDYDYEKSQLLAAQVAQSMQILLQVPFKLDNEDYTLTCSVGITLFNNDECTDDELLKQADLALYQSKRNGRNRYTFFEQEMSQQASRHLQLLSSLRDAITRNEMSLVYQPKVDVQTNKIMGAEALLRWNNNDFGFVSPAEFIPVLEGTSLISLVGEWVLNQAFAQLKKWCDNKAWTDDMSLAINISPKQLLDKTFVEQVEVLLAKHDLCASLIEFEITENVLVENTEKVASVLTKLSDLGISFSIDDFGTGYSSLAYLKQLPIDVLKIDKSFIDHCTIDGGNDQAIVRSVLSICNELSLTSVAEGVESEDQQKVLQQMGCDLLQGYLFSRPVSPEDFIALLN